MTSHCEINSSRWRHNVEQNVHNTVLLVEKNKYWSAANNRWHLTIRILWHRAHEATIPRTIQEMTWVEWTRGPNVKGKENDRKKKTVKEWNRCQKTKWLKKIQKYSFARHKRSRKILILRKPQAFPSFLNKNVSSVNFNLATPYSSAESRFLTALSAVNFYAREETPPPNILRKRSVSWVV